MVIGCCFRQSASPDAVLGELESAVCVLQVTWEYNANLGRFTNFVNLLDMAGIAVPSGLLTGECTCVACKAAQQRWACQP